MGKYKLTWRDIKLEDFKTYLFAMFKAFIPKKKIKTLDELEQFIQTKSAWATQVTLYNYLKTRMGTRYVLHFDNDEFMSSVNLAKWNIYSVALQDLTFFTFSYLKVNFNFQDISRAKEIFNKILDDAEKVLRSSKKGLYLKQTYRLADLKTMLDSPLTGNVVPKIFGQEIVATGPAQSPYNVSYFPRNIIGLTSGFSPRPNFVYASRTGRQPPQQHDIYRATHAGVANPHVNERTTIVSAPSHRTHNTLAIAFSLAWKNTSDKFPQLLPMARSLFATLTGQERPEITILPDNDTDQKKSEGLGSEGLGNKTK